MVNMSVYFVPCLFHYFFVHFCVWCALMTFMYFFFFFGGGVVRSQSPFAFRIFVSCVIVGLFVACFFDVVLHQEDNIPANPLLERDGALWSLQLLALLA